ncbi:MAG: hypothetical protein M3M96_05365, partial [Candidatus Eremiobacteraeota bacterium]|nr:hypothetical protein [Candidatus Eremiobacteraeota bacterium]
QEYSSASDPKWTADILNFVSYANQVAAQNGLAVTVNHPIGTLSDPNEQALLGLVDLSLDEVGFSDYGNYTQTNSLFVSTYNYAETIQRQGKALALIDKFANYTTSLPPSAIEYSIATYLMANEGNLDVYAVGNSGPGYGYGSEQYHMEYASAFGRPCSPMYRDAQNAEIYYRRYEHGLVIVNSGSAQPENATLPPHTYQDIERGPVTSPLSVNSHDAFALLTGSNGCQ